MRPIAFKIIPKTRKIVYMCGKCSASLEEQEDGISKCYNCGTIIDWGNLSTNIPSQFNNSNLKDYMEHQKILNYVNGK